ncbi:hypothetical protein ACFYSF_14570 [Streptomyces canus]|uniref:hypothetical protein n=1 Tax=Streptomyces canus TaxID=58343 RepID=UPI0036C0EBB0
MAGFTHTVSRTRGPGPGLPWAALLAVLLTLLSPPALGSTHQGTPVGALLAAEEPARGERYADRADPGAPVGALLAAEGPAHGEPYADRADPAVSTAAVRSQRDATGERPAPPVSVQGASPAPATDRLLRAQQPVSTASPPTSEQPALRHGVRAPPARSGT